MEPGQRTLKGSVWRLSSLRSSALLTVVRRLRTDQGKLQLLSLIRPQTTEQHASGTLGVGLV